tara:strand:+ start:43766 stop:44518 length:753 start_codon:yes stop_codon:yes gene_type:complete
MSECFFTPVASDTLDCFTEDLRYLDSECLPNKHKLFDQWFEDMISRYGVEVDYQQNLYQLSSHNAIYGEHTTKQFADPQKLTMFVIMNSDAIVLNQFGIESDGDITAFVHIDTFTNIFGADQEPHMGDILDMVEFGGNDRPNGRGSAKFEITRRDDEEISQTNPLLGHYVWLLRGKRYDYSYENNVLPENLINQINDDVAQSTDMTGTAALSSVADNVDKTYEGSSDELGANVFDYDANIDSNDSIYGDY